MDAVDQPLACLLTFTKRGTANPMRRAAASLASEMKMIGTIRYADGVWMAALGLTLPQRGDVPPQWLDINMTFVGRPSEMSSFGPPTAETPGPGEILVVYKEAELNKGSHPTPHTYWQTASRTRPTPVMAKMTDFGAGRTAKVSLQFDRYPLMYFVDTQDTFEVSGTCDGDLVL